MTNPWFKSCSRKKTEYDKAKAKWTYERCKFWTKNFRMKCCDVDGSIRQGWTRKLHLLFGRGLARRIRGSDRPDKLICIWPERVLSVCIFMCYLYVFLCAVFRYFRHLSYMIYLNYTILSWINSSVYDSGNIYSTYISCAEYTLAEGGVRLDTL